MKTNKIDPALLEQNATEAASLLKGIANEHRLMVLCQLVHGERSAGELQSGSTLSQSALSQHLSKLREQGLVSTRREAQSIYYSIANPAVSRVIETLADIFCPEDCA
ncbi:MAG: helix-turn-helix transcriptional regulator [Alphaproteobacteria bacterium]|jgi:ArsR family transcriptional regulator|nr:helix-turn-helix transcriptional regulator [Alphaproteobacteria bacterium]